MMKRFMIRKHPLVITATRIQKKGATTIFDPTLRFRSLTELIHHFAALGVPSYALEATQERIDFTGKATLTFFESEELTGSSRQLRPKKCEPAAEGDRR
jgi:hypothetical protein